MIRRDKTGFKGRAKGLSLIELMISITLGLLILAATVSIFSTNKQTNTATEDVGRVQENIRAVFELMANDIRSGGESPCSRGTDGINTPTGTVWTTRLLGVDGLTGGLQTDTITVQTPSVQTFDITQHIAGAGNGTFNLNTTSFFESWPNPVLVLVCDYRQSAIFQAVPNFNVSPTRGNQLTHDVNLGLDGNPYQFREHSRLAQLETNTWAIVGGNLQRNNQDVIRGVRSMEITYLLNNGVSYVPAAAINPARWDEVVSVRLNLELQGDNITGTDGQQLRRRFIHTVSLRGRSA